MDFSKLDQNDRMIVIESGVLAISGTLTAGWYGLYALTWLAVLAALGALFVVLQPQVAAGITLPGSKGSLLLLFGGMAAAVMVIALLTALGLVFAAFGLPDVMFLVAVSAGIALAWFGWQGFQAEGRESGGTAAVAAHAPASHAEAVADPDPDRGREA